jgi:hypothetical protein
VAGLGGGVIRLRVGGKVMKVIEGQGVLAYLREGCCRGETTVHCPNSNGDYTHVCHVGTLLGTDPHEAGIYSGTAPTGSTPFRRSAVEIVFMCETCPERFALVIQQHKGNNFVQLHAHLPGEEPEGNEA